MNLRLQPDVANNACLFCQAIVLEGLLPGKMPCLSIYKTYSVHCSPTLEPRNPEPLNGNIYFSSLFLLTRLLVYRQRLVDVMVLPVWLCDLLLCFRIVSALTVPQDRE